MDAPGWLDSAALRRLHVYTDVVLVSAGWLLAYTIRAALDELVGRDLNPFASYAAALPLVVLPWIATCWMFGIYRAARMRTLVDQIQDLLRGTLLGLLVLAAIGFFVKELALGRLVVVLCAGLNLAFQAGSRAAFHRFERRLQATGRCDVPALILGAGPTGIRLLQKILDHPEIGFRVVGFLDDQAGLSGGQVERRPVLGTLKRLRDVVIEHRVAEVFIAVPELDHSRMLSLVIDCEDLDVGFRVVTDLFEVLTAGTNVELIDELPLVRIGRRRVPGWYEPAKRILDTGLALGLGLASLPLLAVCAWRIRRDSPGPVLFAQDRVGRHGARFRMWKLRTLVADAAPYARAPRTDDDPRITPFGRFLRRTSLDELPQLWNVLRGEMALVGPRPEMPFIVDEYEEWQRRRLEVKPGITGMWQILGRKDLPMHENLQYDFYYIRARSLLLDLSILLRTVAAVLTRRGAY